jgi:outer membrane receptor protein involved in Fe transport
MASNAGAIVVSNPSLPPQVTNSYNFQVGYYPTASSRITASFYYKAIRNVNEERDFLPGSPQYDETLERLGLSADQFQGPWRITTSEVAGRKGLQRGWEFDLRQNLGLFGNFWTRFDTFLTYSHKEKKESSGGTDVVRIMSSNSDNTYTGGLMYSDRRWSAAVRGVYLKTPWERTSTMVRYGDLVNGVQPQYVIYQTPDNSGSPYRVNVELNYNLSKKLVLFISGNNVLNTKSTEKIFDSGNLMPEYARTREEAIFGVTFSAGVTATF